MLLKLTEYTSGQPLYVEERSIEAIVPMVASVTVHGGDVPAELGMRTRINFCDDVALVRETPDQIRAMMTDR